MTQLHYDAYCGNLEGLLWCVENGSDVNATRRFPASDSHARFPFAPPFGSTPIRTYAGVATNGGSTSAFGGSTRTTSKPDSREPGVADVSRERFWF